MNESWSVNLFHMIPGLECFVVVQIDFRNACFVSFANVERSGPPIQPQRHRNMAWYIFSISIFYAQLNYIALTKNAQLHNWGTDKHPMLTRSTSGSGSGNASTGGRRVKVLGPIDCFTLSYIVKACNVQQLKQIRCMFSAIGTNVN